MSVAWMALLAVHGTVHSMRTTGIALRDPKDQRWMLAPGDQLLSVIGGPTKWALSIAGNNNGGRDVLISAQLTHTGFRGPTFGKKIAEIQGGYGKHVAEALEKLVALPAPKDGEEGSPDLKVRSAILAEYDNARRSSGSGFRMDADDDADDEHDFLSERAAVKQSDDNSLLSSIEIALALRDLDRTAVFYNESRLTACSATKPPQRTQLAPKPGKPADFHVLRVLSPVADWRTLIFLEATDVVIGAATPIALVGNISADQQQLPSQQQQLEKPAVRPAELQQQRGGAGGDKSVAPQNAAPSVSSASATGGPPPSATVTAAADVAVELSTHYAGRFRCVPLASLADDWVSYISLQRDATAPAARGVKRPALQLALYSSYSVNSAFATGGKRKQQLALEQEQKRVPMSVIALLSVPTAKYVALYVLMVRDDMLDSLPEHIELANISTAAVGVLPSEEQQLRLTAVAEKWNNEHRSAFTTAITKKKSTRTARSDANAKMQAASAAAATASTTGPGTCRVSSSFVSACVLTI